MRVPSFEIKMCVFPTELGWMAMAGRDATLYALVFGHESPHAALASLAELSGSAPRDDGWNPRLQERLAAYAGGMPDDFVDVAVQTNPTTEFQRQVIERCRAIPYAQTCTYGELATLAGRSRAARAVGNVMAANLTPLVVPCHRVIAASGRLGGYSAGEGVRLKLRLLEMERSALSAA